MGEKQTNRNGDRERERGGERRGEREREKKTIQKKRGTSALLIRVEVGFRLASETANGRLFSTGQVPLARHTSTLVYLSFYYLLPALSCSSSTTNATAATTTATLF